MNEKIEQLLDVKRQVEEELEKTKNQLKIYKFYISQIELTEEMIKRLEKILYETNANLEYLEMLNK